MVADSTECPKVVASVRLTSVRRGTQSDANGMHAPNCCLPKRGDWLAFDKVDNLKLSSVEISVVMRSA